jgi:serine/threonine protein kinase
VVQLFGSCVVSQQLWVVLEWLPLGSLDRHIYTPERSSISPLWIVRVAMDVARAMLYLHAEKVIHRDMKAANVLIRSLQAEADVRAVVADLGVSRVLRRYVSLSHRSLCRLLTVRPLNGLCRLLNVRAEIMPRQSIT